VLDSIIDFLNRNIAYAYPILFFGSLAESFFPPYPSDGIFVFSAFLAGRGVVSGAKAFILVSAGNLIGMMTVYLLGRKGLRPRLSKWISREDILSKEGAALPLRRCFSTVATENVHLLDTERTPVEWSSPMDEYVGGKESRKHREISLPVRDNCRSCELCRGRMGALCSPEEER